MRISVAIRERLCRVQALRLSQRLLPQYEYNFTPPQLMFLCDCLERTRTVPGPIVEIGCASGRTTLFLNKFMDATGIEKPYYCIDTFAGFTSLDVAHEVRDRGKSPKQYATAWKDWSKELFEATLRLNGVSRARVLQGDINDLDCTFLGAPSLCLIDVDLHRPVKNALEKMYPAMAGTGGMIVVDDCLRDNKYDGALHAYTEFMQSRREPLKLIYDKLGVVETATSRRVPRVAHV